MKYLADIVILLILVFFVLRGYKRGLVKTLFGLFTVMLSIVLAATFGKTAGEFIRKTEIYKDMHIKVEESIEEYTREKSDTFLLKSFGEQSDKSAIPDALSKYGVDLSRILTGDSEQAQNKEEQQAAKEDSQKSLAQRAADSVMISISNATGFIAVFLISLVTLKILRSILDAMANLPLIHSVNKLGGLLAGLVLGACFVFVLTAITEFLLPYLPENPVLYPGMHKDTVLYSFFTGVNPIFLILFG